MRKNKPELDVAFLRPWQRFIYLSMDRPKRDLKRLEAEQWQNRILEKETSGTQKTKT